jgi:peptidoglycan/LPS O-acetylase OafA/YrhL
MKYVYELDAIRGISAIWVMLFHLQPDIFFFPVPGVDVFFVLSGYLMTSIILAKKDSGHFFRVYYARRALRIIPTYLVGLLFVLTVIPLASRTPQPTDAWLNYLTLTQLVPFYWGGEIQAFNSRFGHTWTVAIEVQFYLLYPILLYYVSKRYYLPIMVLMLVFSYMLRESGMPVFLLLTRWDGLIFGGVIAIMEQQAQYPYRKTIYKCLFVGAAISFIYLIAEFIHYGIDPHQKPIDFTHPSNSSWLGGIFLAISLASAGVVALIVLHTGKTWLSVLRSNWLSYLGKISYGLYLYHLLAFWVIDGLDVRLGLTEKLGTFSMNLIKIALTIIVSSLSWHFMEKPILRLKKHFQYLKPKPVLDTNLTS